MLEYFFNFHGKWADRDRVTTLGVNVKSQTRKWRTGPTVTGYCIGVTSDARHCILSIEPANRGSRPRRPVIAQSAGWRSVELVAADDHEGLKAAIREALTEAAWLSCRFHVFRDALAPVPREGDDCPPDLRWFYDGKIAGSACGVWAEVPAV